tara:strand:- start:144 stop:326 length:183 start_codon:yes stop_codon:yes gene_type:complete
VDFGREYEMKKLKEIIFPPEHVVQISTIAKDSGDFYYTITALTNQDRIFIKESRCEWKEI